MRGPACVATMSLGGGEVAGVHRRCGRDEAGARRAVLAQCGRVVDDTIDFASDERGLPVRHASDLPVPRDGVYIFAIPDADDGDTLMLVSPPHRLRCGAAWPAVEVDDRLDVAAGSWLRVVGVS